MEDVWNKYRVIIVLTGLAVVGSLMSAFVVNEEEQVVIVQTGNPEIGRASCRERV